jgi:iron-regulated transporter 1
MPPPPPPRPPSPLPPPLRPQPSGDIGSGGRQFWTEADSLLPDTPLASSSFELGGGGVTAADARRARLALYCSHALSTWGQRGWEFTAGLVMFVIHPSSLLLVAVFGLCDAGAQVALGPAAGAYVDRAPRLRAACSMYVLQNASVAVSAGSCLALLWGAAAPPSTGFWALVGVAVAAGCLSSVGSLGAALSVEREWTRALSGGSSEQLAQINAGMKAIDLTCLLASPIAAGLLLRWRPSAAVGAALAWALAAWAPQCALLARAQAASPALLQPPHPPPAAKLQAGPQAGAGRAARLARGWAVWAAQPTALAALSLALLYLTVLSMGSLMTAYLYSRGMHEAELAAYRGCGGPRGRMLHAGGTACCLQRAARRRRARQCLRALCAIV